MAASAEEVQNLTNAESSGSRIHQWPASPKSALGISGAEPPMTDIEVEFQQTLRRFALEVMRPIGRKLDRMTPEAIIADDSPFWEFRKKYLELGIDLAQLFEMPPEVRSRMFCLIFEELGYGDGGLAISVGAGVLPQYLSALFGNQFLMERFPQEMLGCWAITEPDHGSDTLDPTGAARHADGKVSRSNCIVSFKGDKKKKKKRERENPSDDDEPLDVPEHSLDPVAGTGKLTSSGVVVTGVDTDCTAELSVGDVYCWLAGNLYGRAAREELTPQEDA